MKDSVAHGLFFPDIPENYSQIIIILPSLKCKFQSNHTITIMIRHGQNDWYYPKQYCPQVENILQLFVLFFTTLKSEKHSLI